MSEEKLDPKSADLLKKSQENVCALLAQHWGRAMRCYGEALEEHKNTATEDSKKMVFNIPIAVRLCDTDGDTKPDAKIRYGISFSGSRSGQSVSGHPEFNFTESVAGEGVDPDAIDE